MLQRPFVVLVLLMQLLAVTSHIWSDEPVVRKLHYRQDSPVRLKIEQALDTVIEPGVVISGSLPEVMAGIEQHFQIPCAVDTVTLHAGGRQLFGPRKLTLSTGIALRDSLEAAFELPSESVDRDEKLDCLIRYDILLLTTRSESDAYLESVLYDVRGLPADLLLDCSRLLEIIQTGTSSGWLIDGLGEGTFCYFPGGLMIRQTQRVHREIASLLDRLMDFNEVPREKILATPSTRGERVSPMERKIQAVLLGPPPPNLEQATTIDELVLLLNQQCHIRVKISSSITDACRSDTRIRLRGLNALANSLSYALENHDECQLAFLIQRDSLVITTRDEADELLETRVYDLQGLPAHLIHDQKTMEMMIEGGVSGGWLNSGLGEGTMTAFSNGLVIRQTQRIHREIQDLLVQLREFAAQKGYPDPPECRVR